MPDMADASSHDRLARASRAKAATLAPRARRHRSRWGAMRYVYVGICACGALAIGYGIQAVSRSPCPVIALSAVAQADMESIRDQLRDAVARTAGMFPASVAGVATVLPDETARLLDGARMVDDPWGNAYIYEASADRRTFVLRSFGADAAPGGCGEAGDLEVTP